MGKKRKEKQVVVPVQTVDEDAKPPASKKAKVDDVECIEKPGTSKHVTADEQRDKAEKLQLLVAAFGSNQQDQYEVFRRATLQKGTVRRLMQTVTGTIMSQNVVIAMAGMAKVFVGEIVELGCHARDNWGETGPLQPKHVREAVRKLRRNKKIVDSRHRQTVDYR